MSTGLIALCRREVARVLKLWTQTVVAPILSSALFILVFGLSLGGRIRFVEGVPYREFIVPGLIAMSMAQAAYANNSASVFQARFDRYLNDVLAAPMRNCEINLGLAVGGGVRAVLICGGLAALRGALRAPCSHGRARFPRSNRADRRRPRPPPRDPPAGRRAGPDALRRLRRGRGDLRAQLGPHRLHPEHRHPPAELPGRGLLLGRRAALAVAGDLAPQPDLLPDQRRALRLPGDQRRQRLALARGDGRPGGGSGRVERMAVQDR